MLNLTQKPFAASARKASGCPVRVYGRRTSVVVKASQQSDVSRRALLSGAAATIASVSAPGAVFAAKAPKGFNSCEDSNDGYKFLYPFGWQEVAVNGTDVVFKDIVEPLESVSVTLTKTDKKDITEFGDVQLVSETLAKQVLSSPNQEVKVIKSEQRELNGRNYYEFEFTTSNGSYTRHQLAVVAAANDTFYTLTTGSNEKRWNRIKDRLQTTVRSFTLLF